MKEGDIKEVYPSLREGDLGVDNCSAFYRRKSRQRETCFFFVEGGSLHTPSPSQGGEEGNKLIASNLPTHAHSYPSSPSKHSFVVGWLAGEGSWEVKKIASLVYRFFFLLDEPLILFVWYAIITIPTSMVEVRGSRVRRRRCR